MKQPTITQDQIKEVKENFRKMTHKKLAGKLGIPLNKLRYNLNVLKLRKQHDGGMRLPFEETKVIMSLYVKRKHWNEIRVKVDNILNKYV